MSMFSVKKLSSYTAEKYFLVSELEQADKTEIVCSDDFSAGLNLSRSSSRVYDILLFYFMWDVEVTDSETFSEEVHNMLTWAIVKNGFVKTISSSNSSSSSCSNSSFSSGRVAVCIDIFDTRLKNTSPKSHEEGEILVQFAELPCAQSVSDAHRRIQLHIKRLLGVSIQDVSYSDTISSSSSSSSNNSHGKIDLATDDDNSSVNVDSARAFILFAVGDHRKASSALESISDLCRSTAAESFTKAVVVKDRDRFISLPCSRKHAAGLASIDTTINRKTSVKDIGGSADVCDKKYESSRMKVRSECDDKEKKDEEEKNDELMEPHGASGVLQYMVVPSSIASGASDSIPYFELPLLAWTLSYPGTDNASALAAMSRKRESPYEDDENSFIGSMLVVLLAVLIPLVLWHFKWFS